MTQDLLHELFDYENGNLIWKSNRGGTARKGSVAGTREKKGYIAIRVNCKPCKAHRLVWIMHNGDIPKEMQLDHINRIRDDNRIENLRLVNQNQNQWNSNRKGFSYKRGKFEVRLQTNFKRIHIGRFNTEQEAHHAYVDAKKKYHGVTI